MIYLHSDVSASRHFLLHLGDGLLECSVYKKSSQPPGATNRRRAAHDTRHAEVPTNLRIIETKDYVGSGEPRVLRVLYNIRDFAIGLLRCVMIYLIGHFAAQCVEA